MKDAGVSVARDQLNGALVVMPYNLEILMKGVCVCVCVSPCVCVCIWEGNNEEVFRGSEDLSIAPQLADEIKTPATGKVRATDNWKYWHEAQRPLGWIRTIWVIDRPPQLFILIIKVNLAPVKQN